MKHRHLIALLHEGNKGGNEMTDIDALKRDKRPQSAWVVHALIDRLEAAEKERDELRAKTTEMEKQEPVRWFYVTNGEWDCYSRERPPEDAYDAGSLMALYALPGAKGE